MCDILAMNQACPSLKHLPEANFCGMVVTNNSHATLQKKKKQVKKTQNLQFGEEKRTKTERYSQGICWHKAVGVTEINAEGS